jgi:hypothetical protein
MDAKVDLIPRATIVDIREDQSLVSSADRAPKVIRKEVLDLLDHKVINWRCLPQNPSFFVGFMVEYWSCVECLFGFEGVAFEY